MAARAPLRARGAAAAGLAELDGRASYAALAGSVAPAALASLGLVYGEPGDGNRRGRARWLALGRTASIPLRAHSTVSFPPPRSLSSWHGYCRMQKRFEVDPEASWWRKSRSVGDGRSHQRRCLRSCVIATGTVVVTIMKN